VTFTHDALGRRKTRTDRKGQLTQYAYDISSRLIQKTYAGGQNVNFTYDANGNMLSAMNSISNVSFTYDDIDQRTSETINGKTTTYTYGAKFEDLEILYPGGKKVIESYDLRGRLENLKDNTRTLVDFTYGPDDQVTTIAYANGVNTQLTYNSLGLLTNQHHGSFVNENFTYDGEENVLLEEKLHRPTHSREFFYDETEQLLGEKRGTLIAGQVLNPLTEIQFQYDQLGNRQSMTLDTVMTAYQKDVRNIYTQAGSQIMQYDMHSNLINDGQQTYEYDAEHRLIAVKQSGNLLAAYRYDPLGRRIMKIVPGDTTWFYYSFNEVIEERDRNDNILATYVYGEGVDEIYYAEINGEELYYHTDLMGSVQALTNDRGRMIEYYEYTAFGEMTIMDSLYQSKTTSQFGNPYGFTGRRFETETGLVYFRNRYYSPDLGRFIQPDPLGYIDAPNLYQYAYNDPGSYLDPFGLSTSFEQKSVADRILDIIPRKKFSFSGTLTLWIIPTPAGPIVVDFTLEASAEPCCKEKSGKKGIKVDGTASISFTYSWGYGEEPSDEEESGWLLPRGSFT